MKKICVKTSVLLLTLMVNCMAITQETSNNENQDNKLLKAAREIIAESSNCALITIDEKGNPRVRAMDPFPPADDFEIWFGTNKNSRKVGQIKLDPRVNLYYMENDNSSYVTISGKAELIDDPEIKNKYWKDQWNAFYGEKKENYLLIKVTPAWLEVSSAKRGLNGDSVTWQPEKINFRK